jgi:hypothetical protein
MVAVNGGCGHGWHFLRVLPEPCSGSGTRGRGTTTPDWLPPLILVMLFFQIP